MDQQELQFVAIDSPEDSLATAAGKLIIDHFTREPVWTNGGQLYAAVDHGNIIGVANFLATPENPNVEVKYLVVDQNHRDQQVATRLLGSLITHLEEAGYQQISLLPLSSDKLYSNLGFTHFDPDSAIMSRRLGADSILKS